MYTHRETCILNYDTTDKSFEVEDILDVFDNVENRWFLMKYNGYEPEWSREMPVSTPER